MSFRINTRKLALVLVFALFGMTGCFRSETGSNSSNASENADPSDQTPALKSGIQQIAEGDTPEVGSGSFGHTDTPVPERSASDERTSPSGVDLTNMIPGDVPNNQSQTPPPSNPAGFPLAETRDSNQPPKNPADRNLRGDLTPTQLTEFISESDRIMELIAKGLAGEMTHAEANQRHMQLAKQKLDASVRLADHPDANEEQRSNGVRGQIQALSHMTGNGDLESAKKLETVAAQHANSTDPMIASDCRIVLMGFAVESLRNGERSAPAQVQGLVDQIASSGNADVATLMVLGQARQTLATFGHQDEAASVTSSITKLFGDAKDPTVAKMAADLAGEARFDLGNRLIFQANNGGNHPRPTMDDRGS